MYLAKIYVTYKPSILDPQGEVIKSALTRLDYTGISQVSQGKYFEVKLDARDVEAANAEVKSFTDSLLINQNTETYRFDLSIVNEDEAIL
ncbi:MULTISPECIES: phosphoribosylformylglycinamidine synthase subunit PurS [Leuconostoc]|jgi:phosphoribosylformylglycinamidine synthase subunit PurS|uniref:Phosphoribosylformylglycinamidine synthase subunit PurS n=1 Tax=Leuconostoc pseudomesenteroides TaxID=33968 RepID=A0A5B8T4T7_LEUPS|nr:MULTISPECIES: phosphoribosylformylglycinamidine synthase subunit PurS [Leuconostoc]MBK0039871.1 phosphoribosylformylglycinamidine synthase subunit PurS [Leuconostoc sp. S51]MBK0050830.1 phosphoribosylformylglycinamidine synthase subunit PurS [Leuconostoc sp. S50]MBS0957010.1 phosphoribosylformylglycinamidine synthase subunit PurS [Leuconostoc pseudomesenteroides]MCC7668176.1 phosphoribosylformylglycinamidine synthase subunit PurS [Leuconostoc pseudomesenteroides]MCC8439077.1 phosphoribosylf